MEVQNGSGKGLVFDDVYATGGTFNGAVEVLQKGGYETVGGFVINAFGYLPKRGETTNFDRFAIKVLRADKRRVKLLLFTQVKSDNSLESKTEKE